MFKIALHCLDFFFQNTRLETVLKTQIGKSDGPSKEPLSTEVGKVNVTFYDYFMTFYDLLVVRNYLKGIKFRGY